jgi:hypothetical protein
MSSPHNFDFIGPLEYFYIFRQGHVVKPASTFLGELFLTTRCKDMPCTSLNYHIRDLGFNVWKRTLEQGHYG